MPLTEINPVTKAIHLMRQAQYPEAAKLLYAEYEKNTNFFLSAQIANMIDNGMINEAIDALQRISSNLEAYQANQPADEHIGCTAKQHNAFPKGRW